MTSVLVLFVTLLLFMTSIAMGLIAMAIGRLAGMSYGNGFLWGSALGPLGIIAVAVYVAKNRLGQRGVGRRRER